MSEQASTSRRTNVEWLTELRGERGFGQQETAHRDLARYLYIVAYNYLRQRQHNLPPLGALDPQEHAALAQDFVQEVLLKIAQNNFALLHQFRNTGAFTSWVATILCNLIARELARPFWRQRTREEDAEQLISTRTPEQITQIEHLRMTIQGCVDHLPSRRRLAFEGCIVQNIDTAEVAQQLQTTINSVHQLVFHARRELRLCLEKQGIGPDALALFRE